ncbi:MAG: Ig-like domain-containing protein, partial [Actinobacteria bacterium]|nr:Ig-like domain-containing protein [Actinomycetota bacterium]
MGDGRTLVYTPAQAWLKDALIQVFLDSTAQDQTGKALNSYQGSFRIEEDSTKRAPYVVAINAQGNGVTVPLNPVIDLLFNEALDATSVNSEAVVLENNDLFGQPVPVTVSLLKGNRVLRLVPNDLLTAGPTYNVAISTGLKDATGTPYSGFGNYNFSAGLDVDGMAPKVVALTPTDGATNVGINSKMTMRFDEPVSPISFLGADADLPLAQTPTPYEDARYYSLSFTDDNRQVSYVPHEPWPASSDVTVTVASPEDYAGHPIQSVSH